MQTAVEGLEIRIQLRNLSSSVTAESINVTAIVEHTAADNIIVIDLPAAQSPEFFRIAIPMSPAANAIAIPPEVSNARTELKSHICFCLKVKNVYWN